MHQEQMSVFCRIILQRFLLGNHPFSTRLRCSKISKILQKQVNANTPAKTDHSCDSMNKETAADNKPDRRNTHQHLTPK